MDQSNRPVQQTATSGGGLATTHKPLTKKASLMPEVKATLNSAFNDMKKSVVNVKKSPWLLTRSSMYLQLLLTLLLCLLCCVCSSLSPLLSFCFRQLIALFVCLKPVIITCFLWHCWLGSRKGIQPVKNWVVGCWRGYLSGVRCRLAYGPADATATHCLLLQENPDSLTFLVLAHLGR